MMDLSQRPSSKTTGLHKLPMDRSGRRAETFDHEDSIKAGSSVMQVVDHKYN
jgi:hypothetical protein